MSRAEPPPERHQEWVVGIRAIASVAVVGYHVASSLVWDSPWLSERPQWWFTGAFFEALTTGGVPLFTMVSGALLLNPKTTSTLQQFLRKRFMRILPPYVVWCAVYAVWKTRSDDVDFTWDGLLSDIVLGNAYYHLWFLPMLLGLYLLTPLLKVAMTHGTKPTLWFSAAVLTAWFVVLPAVYVALGWQEATASGYAGYGLYFVLGHLLATLPKGKTILLSSVVVWGAGVALVVLRTYTHALEQGGVLSEELGDHNFYPEVFALAVAAFLVLRIMDWPALLRVPLLAAPIRAASSSSFTIYLAHPLLLEAHGYVPALIVLTPDWTHPALAVPLAVVLITSLCIAFRSAVTLPPLPHSRPLQRALAP